MGMGMPMNMTTSMPMGMTSSIPMPTSIPMNISSSIPTTAAGSATAAAGSATAAALFAGIATGSAGISGLLLLGNALINAGGEIQILSFPIQAPLQIQNEAIGLSINKNELNLNNGGYLELNDTYTSLIEWDRPSYAETLLKISLEGVSGIGVKDVLNSHTVRRQGIL